MQKKRDATTRRHPSVFFAVKRELLPCIVHEFDGAVEGVGAFLLLGLHINGGAGFVVHPLTKFLKALHSVLRELYDSGLGLRQHLVEVRDLFLRVLGVIAEAIAALHCVDEEVGRGSQRRKWC